jgi:parallel beta-helix repeat protein
VSRKLAIGLITGLVGALVVLPLESAVAANTFNPVADSFVDAGSPTSNYGTRAYMRADASPIRRGYLRFNVVGVGGPSSAALKIFVETSTSTGLQVRPVGNTTWGETSINYNNAPAVGGIVDSTGGVGAGTWVTFNVSVTGDGPVSFAVTTTSNTAIRFTSKEGANQPQLIVPAPGSPSPYLVTRSGGTYEAVSQATGTTFTGTLKFAVESAVADLKASGGGTVNFAADTFDFGASHFDFDDVADIEFAGSGMDATIIQNHMTTAADTEPFDFSGADRVTVRDMTISAGGPARSTSDALDFDRGNDVLVENVKITASRGRGIVFDGKNENWTSLRNWVRNCVIDGVPSDGIELLASSQNTIEGCTITNVGGHGIQATKSSTTADQPNKKSSDNLITGNVIDESGQDGVNLNSGDRNEITGNTITNSANVTSSRDGIRISSSDSITCDDNVVAHNTATDTQTVKTQRYGLNISSSLCNRTVVGPGNDFSGNKVAPINDAGTGTIYP